MDARSLTEPCRWSKVEGARLRTVIADDNEAMRVLLQTFLSLDSRFEIVGACGDGASAARMVAETVADVAVLDVEMPSLGGLEAAEVVLACQPQCRPILMTATPNGVAAAAARLRVPLIDKLAADALAPTIAGEGKRQRDFRERREVEPLVLSALRRREGEAVLVARAGGSIAFYNTAAADVLRAPFPPPPKLHVRNLAPRLQPVTRDGKPRSLETRPLFLALSEKRAAADEICQLEGETIVAYRAKSLPFFDSRGRFIGAAAYWTRHATQEFASPESAGAGAVPGETYGRSAAVASPATSRTSANAARRLTRREVPCE